MDELLADLAAQHAELEGLVAGLDEAGWRTPSRCEGWDARDVVLHLAQTDELAVASLEGRLDGWSFGGDVDAGAGAMVEHERGSSGAEVLARWSAAAGAMRAAFASTDPSARVRWVAGELAARTLAATRIAECWLHTGDVAHGLGVGLAPTARLRHVARLAWRTLPYAFARAGRDAPGPVAFVLTGPGGDEWRFEPGEPGAGAPTTVTGPAEDLCLVAGQRLAASASALRADGPDAEAVLALVRTFA